MERREALEKGLKYYNTGRPCKHGHYADRRADGRCTECLKEARKKLWHSMTDEERAAYAEERSDYFKAYRQTEKYKEANRKRMRALLERDPDYYKRRNKKNKGVKNDE